MAVTARWLLIGVPPGRELLVGDRTHRRRRRRDARPRPPGRVNTCPTPGALRPGIRTGAVVYLRTASSTTAAPTSTTCAPGTRRCPARDPPPAACGRVPLLTGPCAPCGAGPPAPAPHARAPGSARRTRPVASRTCAPPSRASALRIPAGVGAATRLRRRPARRGRSGAAIRWHRSLQHRQPAPPSTMSASPIPYSARSRVTCTAGSPVLSGLRGRRRATCTAEPRRALGTYPSRSRAEGGGSPAHSTPAAAPSPHPRLIAYASARITSLTAAAAAARSAPGTTAPRPPAPPARGVAPRSYRRNPPPPHSGPGGTGPLCPLEPARCCHCRLRHPVSRRARLGHRSPHEPGTPTARTSVAAGSRRRNLLGDHHASGPAVPVSGGADGPRTFSNRLFLLREASLR